MAILFEALKSNHKYLEMEGIFRKSGSIEEEEEIIVEMSKMAGVGPLKNIDEFSGFAVAGVVKKFFTKLVTPIVPFEIYNKLIYEIGNKGISKDEEVDFVKDFLSKLPQLNKKIIIQLFIFLKEHVISKMEINKMNMYNMSVCFCPCVFRSEVASLNDLMNAGKFAGILHILFQRF